MDRITLQAIGVSSNSDFDSTCSIRRDDACCFSWTSPSLTFWARILYIKGFREIHPSHHPSHDPSLTPHINTHVNPPICLSFVSVSASGCMSMMWGMMWEICEGWCERYVRDKKHPSHSFSPLYKGFSEDYVRDEPKIVRSLQKNQGF